jgi:cytochrome c peroxidase
MLPTLAQVCSLASPFETDVADYAAGQCRSLEVYLTKLEQYLDGHDAGDVKRLEDQIHKSVGSTMRGVSISERQASDLAAFLRTLRPPPSVDRLRQRISAPRVRRGRRVFEKQGCARCHAEPQMTTANIYDVGVRDEVGKDRFNPPSLRGVSQGRYYLHDNRAKSLRSLFEKHRHQLDAKLTGSQLDDLIAFLRSL